MAKRAEAALGFSQKSPLPPQFPSLHGPSPMPFLLASGTRPEREAVDSQLVVPDSGFWVPDLKLGGWLQTSGPGLHALGLELVSSFWGPHSGSGLKWASVSEFQSRASVLDIRCQARGSGSWRWALGSEP